MRTALPHAAFIALTGASLLKDEKTVNKFGSIIHAYTMQQAVRDDAVVPLLYEEHQSSLDINQQAIGDCFSEYVRKISPGLKGQLSANSKVSAIRYKQHLNAIGKVASAVIISPSDTRENHEIIQAIVRVNRLHPEKQHDFIVDNRGILSPLDTAIHGYQDLATCTQPGYEIGDINGLHSDVSTEYKKLRTTSNSLGYF